MNEKYGVEVFKSAALAVAEILSVAYAVFIEKKGLWQLLSLQGPAKVLSSLDFAKLKLEISDLSEAEREDLEAAFKAALHPALQAKVGGGVNLLEKGLDLGEDVVAQGKKLYADGLAYLEAVKQIVAEAKALVGA